MDEIVDLSNKPVDVESRLATAQSGEEIKSLLNVGNDARPSGTTRRRWLRAANKRYGELNEIRRQREIVLSSEEE